MFFGMQKNNAWLAKFEIRPNLTLASIETVKTYICLNYGIIKYYRGVGVNFALVAAIGVDDFFFEAKQYCPVFQVHIIARAGASTRTKLLAVQVLGEIGHSLKCGDCCFALIGLQMERGIPKTSRESL